MSAARPLLPLLLIAAAASCSGRTPTEVSAPEPVDCPDEPTPAVEAPVPEPHHPPLLHSGYMAVLSTTEGYVHVEKYFEFVGDMVRVRVRYVGTPDGTIQSSRYRSCEAQLDLPIRWTERGFTVANTLTVTAERGDFERTELEPTSDGRRQADTNKSMQSCWLTVLEGDYRLEEISTATVKGRPKTARLVEPDGKERLLEAVGPATESDLLQAMDEFFWSQ